jgi:general L-amino acid transport system permease protein
MASEPSSAPQRSAGSIFQDTRFINLLVQAAVVALLVTAVAFFARNVVMNLRSSNIPLGWSFLSQSAGFRIAEGPPFDPTESYGRAFVVGIVNTLRVVVAGIVLATIVGLVVGIARLSSNWLVRNLAGGYINIIRNTPLLVQLFFWYTAVILQLPDIKEHMGLGNAVILSNRGMVMGWFYVSETGSALTWWLIGALVAGWLARRLRRRQLERAGRLDSGLLVGILAFVGVLVAGYIVTDLTATLPANTTYEIKRGDRGTLFADVNNDGEFDANLGDKPIRYTPVTLFAANGVALGEELTENDGTFRYYDLPAEGASLTWIAPAPLIYSAPEFQGFNVRGGRTFSPEYTALLLGLVLYTGAFIAEIVRAGINAVPKGQWEASRAVGLSNGATLRLIVLPQALRVIIPPLTSQYLNLTKNSSLAIAIAYPDLFNVSLTIMNQSGATVQMFLLIMLTYLSFSLFTSLVMNVYNKRMALVER